MTKRSPANDRQKAERRGKFAESLCVRVLRLKGYSILERNFKTKLGEIDVIARKVDLIAIIEVKARKDLDSSINAVSHASVKRIYDAADLWLAKQRDAHLLSMRFDILAVQPNSWPKHIENAF